MIERDKLPSWYISSIKKRSRFKYIVGLIFRLLVYCKYSLYRFIAELSGAKIGDNTVIPFRLACTANSNLSIGENVIIESSDIDLRAPIRIEDNVIINRDVTIIRLSHNIDNDSCYSLKRYPDLHIQSYSWLATGCKVMPSVSNISKGTICSAFSVLHKSTEEMGVYTGNPAYLLKTHNSLFIDMIVPYLKTCDYKYYKMARKSKPNYDIK